MAAGENSAFRMSLGLLPGFIPEGRISRGQAYGEVDEFFQAGKAFRLNIHRRHEQARIPPAGFSAGGQLIVYASIMAGLVQAVKVGTSQKAREKPAPLAKRDGPQ